MLLIRIQGEGRKIKVPFDGEAQGQIGIAIRPEKLRLSKEEPDGEAIRLPVKITNTVYYGNASHIYVENDRGLRLTVDFRNEARTLDPSIVIGNEMWVSWQPEDTLVLVE